MTAWVVRGCSLVAVACAAVACAGAPEPAKPARSSVVPVPEPTVTAVASAEPAEIKRVAIGSTFTVDPDEPLPKGAVARCGTTRMRVAAAVAVAVSNAGVIWALDRTTSSHLMLRDVTRGVDVVQLPHTSLAALAPDASFVALEPTLEGGVLAFYSVPGGARMGEVQLPRGKKKRFRPGQMAAQEISQIEISPDGGGVVIVAGRDEVFLIDPVKYQITKTTRLPPKHELTSLSRAGHRALFELKRDSEETFPVGMRYTGPVLGYTVMDLRTGAVVRQEKYKPPPPNPDFPPGMLMHEHAWSTLRLSLDGARLYRDEGSALSAIDLPGGKVTQIGFLPLPPDGPGGWPGARRSKPVVVLGGGQHVVVDGAVVKLADMNEERTFQGSFQAASPDGKWVVTRSKERFTRLPDDVSLRAGHVEGVRDLAFLPDNTLLTTADKAIFWGTAACEPTKQHDTSTRVVATALQRAMVFLDGDGWEPLVMNEQGVTRKLPIARSVGAAAFMPDGSRLFLGVAEDKTGVLMSIDPTGASTDSPLSRTFPEPIRSIAVAPDASLMAVLVGAGYGWNSGSIEVVSPDDLSIRRRAVVKGAASVAFSGPGTIVHSAERAGISVRSMASLDEIRAIHRGLCCDETAVSPDGKLAAGSQSSSLFVWELATRKLVGHVPTAHRLAITALAFSADSLFLATGSKDTTVLLWDTRQLGVPPLPQKLETVATSAADAKRFMEAAHRPTFRIKADGTLELLSTRRGIKTPALKKVTRVVSAHDDAHCAIADSKVRCWGSTRFGAIGIPEEKGNDKGGAGVRDTPITLPVNDPVDLQMAPYYTCALERAGDVICWGRVPHADPVVTPGKVLSGVKSIVVTNHKACALGLDGIARCWGDVGITPQPLPLKDVTAIAIADGHMCVTDTGGKVRCSGNNQHDQLGDDTGLDRTDFVLAAGVNDAVAIAVGYTSTCALMKDGAVFCWGEIDHASLARPTRLTALDGSTAIKLDGQAVCGLRGDKVDCLKFPAEP